MSEDECSSFKWPSGKDPFSGKNVQMPWPAQLECQEDQINFIHYTIHECYGIIGYNMSYFTCSYWQSLKSAICCLLFRIFITCFDSIQDYMERKAESGKSFIHLLTTRDM